MYCTDPETHTARKVHRCMSCGEPIAIGEKYARWRCYDGGDTHEIRAFAAIFSSGGEWREWPTREEIVLARLLAHAMRQTGDL